MVVFASLSFEIVGVRNLSSHLFRNELDIIAYLLAFVAAIFWALYSTLSRKFGEDTGKSAVIPLFQLTVGLVLPFSFIPGMGAWQNIDLETALIFFAYCLLQFIAYLCWDHGMRNGNVVSLSLCADFMPWLSLITAYVLLGTNIGPETIFSAVLLVAGAFITRYGTTAKKAIAP